MNNLRDLIGESLEDIIYAIANSVEFHKSNSHSVNVQRVQSILQLYYTVVRLFRGLTEREQGAICGKGRIPVLLISIKADWDCKTLVISLDLEEELPFIDGDGLCGSFRGVFGSLSSFVSSSIDIDDIDSIRIGYNPQIEWD